MQVHALGSYDGRVKILSEDLFLLTELQLPAAVMDLACHAQQLFVW